MPKGIFIAQHHKRQIDREISHAYRELSLSASTTAAFTELLRTVRLRSTLLQQPYRNETRGRPVEFLRNLAVYNACYVRRPTTWSGEAGSSHSVTASLAQHLFARFPVPRFLSRVWFGGYRPEEQRKRQWYLAHGSGLPFRKLALPMLMTRKMERVFLHSPDHLTLEQAMRRAELVALGAGPNLAKAVLASRLGHDLASGEFWRTVLIFFVRVSDRLDPSQVAPIVDFIQAMRFGLGAEADDATTRTAALQPEFSMRGRSLPALMRLVSAWHRRLGRSCCPKRSWQRSRYRPMVIQDAPRTPTKLPVIWEFTELNDSEALRLEGLALHHCVGSYALLCFRGRSRIWSLRRRTRSDHARSVITVEVNPRLNTIVQARGLRNRPVSGRAKELLMAWARREDLRLRI